MRMYILWAIPAGKRDPLNERPLTSMPLTKEQADKVRSLAAAAGWHSFRLALETDAPPDFAGTIQV